MIEILKYVFIIILVLFLILGYYKKIKYKIDFKNLFNEIKEKEFDECCICRDIQLYYASFICGHHC